MRRPGSWGSEGCDKGQREAKTNAGAESADGWGDEKTLIWGVL